MNNLDVLKQIYDNYDLVGDSAHNNKTGTYSDENSSIFKKVLFANIWVCAMNLTNEGINVEKAFDGKAENIFNTIMRLENKCLNTYDRILTEEELQRLAHFYLPYKEINYIVNYLYANSYLLDNWVRSNDNNKTLKLVKES